VLGQQEMSSSMIPQLSGHHITLLMSQTGGKVWTGTW
jgi:hypothetical protein